MNKANVEEEYKHIQKYNHASECSIWSYICKNSNKSRFVWSLCDNLNRSYDNDKRF